jgi:hypothetical protein
VRSAVLSWCDGVLGFYFKQLLGFHMGFPRLAICLFDLYVGERNDTFRLADRRASYSNERPCELLEILVK